MTPIVGTGHPSGASLCHIHTGLSSSTVGPPHSHGPQPRRQVVLPRGTEVGLSDGTFFLKGPTSAARGSFSQSSGCSGDSQSEVTVQGVWM